MRRGRRFPGTGPGREMARLGQNRTVTWVVTGVYALTRFPFLFFVSMTLIGLIAFSEWPRPGSVYIFGLVMGTVALERIGSRLARGRVDVKSAVWWYWGIAWIGLGVLGILAVCAAGWAEVGNLPQRVAAAWRWFCGNR